MDISVRYAPELCQDRIKDKVQGATIYAAVFSEYHGRYFSFERTQNSPCRSRGKPGYDAGSGGISERIQIIHTSDMEKRNKENKRRDGRTAGVYSQASGKNSLERMDMKPGKVRCRPPPCGLKYGWDRNGSQNWNKIRQVKEEKERGTAGTNSACSIWKFHNTRKVSRSAFLCDQAILKTLYIVLIT